MTFARTQRNSIYFARCAICLLALVSDRVLHSQTTPSPAPITEVGIAPYDSYSLGADQLNLNDLGLHVDIPLFRHRSSRGGQGITVHLVYDSTYYDDNMGWSSNPTPGNGQQLSITPNIGWRVQVGNT